MLCIPNDIMLSFILGIVAYLDALCQIPHQCGGFGKARHILLRQAQMLRGNVAGAGAFVFDEIKNKSTSTCNIPPQHLSLPQ